MAHFDFPLHELQTYQPRQTRQPDFEAFWRDTLAQSAAHPLDIHLDELDLPYTGARIARLSYAGWDGANIVGTYAVPAAPGPFSGGCYLPWLWLGTARPVSAAGVGVAGLCSAGG
ncbi:MAG: acetylxylan esterase [Chloroflexaceae bacterium]|nr:acetylxylan esterase [Chloroflexaceae bacterium]